MFHSELTVYYIALESLLQKIEPLSRLKEW